MKPYSLVFAVIAASGLYSVGGCGSGSVLEPTDIVVPDETTICDKAVDQCGLGTYGSIDQCHAKFAALRVSQACADSLKTASCDDLSDAGSAVQTACFPACDNAGTNTCIFGGRAITDCQAQASDGDAGILITYDCEGICKLQGASGFAGVCGTTYGGQTRDHAVCWCTY